MELIDTTPVSVSQIQIQTAHDLTYSKVKEFVMNGWTDTHTLSPEFQPFVIHELELSVQNDCLLWGSRVVVPPKLRDRVLQELHNSHPGSSQMKSLARQYFWWPGINQAIENTVKIAKFVRKHATNLLQQLYTLGTGLKNPGKEFMLIMRAIPWQNVSDTSRC